MKSTREEVIQMAREAGGETRYFSLDHVEGFSFFTMPEFERFAAACYRQGVDDAITTIDSLPTNPNLMIVPEDASNAIRALLGSKSP